MVNTEIRLITLFATKDGEILYSQQKQDWELDCGSDHELLIAKFRLKLKKVGKTTGLLRYYLDQVPYDYPQEVTNRFKGLDLIARLKNYGRRLCHCTGGGDQHNSQEKRNAKRQNGCLRRPYK